MNTNHATNIKTLSGKNTEAEILTVLTRYNNSNMTPVLPLSFLGKYRVTLQQAAHQTYRILQANRYQAIPYNLANKKDPSVKSNDSCAQSIVIVAVDCLSFVFTVLGILNSDLSEKISESVVSRLTPDELNGLDKYIIAIAESEDAFLTATAIVNFTLGIINLVGGPSSLLSIIEDSMSFWDWLECGVTVTLQVMAFVLTDGAEEIAEMALLAASLTLSALDAANAIAACDL